MRTIKNNDNKKYIGLQYKLQLALVIIILTGMFIIAIISLYK